MFASRIRLSIEKGFGAGARLLGHGKAVQDMPPPGGFPKIETARNLPDRGPSGAMLWGGSALIIMWGFAMVGRENHKRSNDAMESRESRLAIIPLLQAESDLRTLQQEIDDTRIEAAIMKDVKGWEVGKNPYKSGVWMPRPTHI
jgi:NADH dehydrogenase (ubiquinone) 1 alpha subcomplex subunit 13